MARTTMSLTGIERGDLDITTISFLLYFLVSLSLSG